MLGWESLEDQVESVTPPLPDNVWTARVRSSWIRCLTLIVSDAETRRVDDGWSRGRVVEAARRSWWIEEGFAAECRFGLCAVNLSVNR